MLIAIVLRDEIRLLARTLSVIADRER